MRMRISDGCLLGVLIVALLASPSVAEDRAPAVSDRDATVARLEAQLEAQQRQIETLGRQVAQAQQAGADAERAEALRKQVRELFMDQEFRESIMPSMLQAGYDNGFFIRSSDDNFLMKFNGGMQVRWTYYNTQTRNRYQFPRLDRDDRTGFDVQRIRFGIGGHAYTKDLTYYMEFRADAPDAYDVVADAAWVNYRIADEFQFKAGVMSLGSTRADSVAVLNQQSIDRPMSDAVFSLGTGIGASLWGQLFDKRLEYHVTVVNSLADGRNAAAGRVITSDPSELDNNPAILFRAVWHALGDNPGGDFAYQSDIPKHDSPALDFAFRYAYNEDRYDRFTTRIPFPRPNARRGGYGLTSTNGLQIHQFGVDTAFKWMGFSATGEYIVRTVDIRRANRAPFTPWYLLTGDDDTTAQHGAYLQLGYFLPIPGVEDKLEAVARVGGISTLAGEREGTWEYAFGMNYYFNKDVKLQADVVRMYELPTTSSYSSMANVNDDALVFRVQFQVAF